MLSLKKYTDLHQNNVKSIRMAIQNFRFHIIFLKSLHWNKIRKEATINSFSFLAEKSVIFFTGLTYLAIVYVLVSDCEFVKGHAQ